MLKSEQIDSSQEQVQKLTGRVWQGDCRGLIASIADNSVHLILSDIPYGIGAEDWDVLHRNSNSAYLGSSPAQVKAGSVFKKRGKPLNGWSDADRKIPLEYYEWCKTWASDWLRVLKPGGSALVFAGRRLAHRCVMALEDSGFVYRDTIAWIRKQAPHRAQRISLVYERREDHHNAKEWTGWRVGNLRPKFEPILWLVKPYKIGTTIADNVLNHQVGGFHESVWCDYASEPDNVIHCGYSPEEIKCHPTQKPLRLMQALVELVTTEGQTVLDPFAGSGTTLLAAQKLGRKFIGFELKEEYYKIAKDRLNNDLRTGSMELPFDTQDH